MKLQRCGVLGLIGGGIAVLVAVLASPLSGSVAGCQPNSVEDRRVESDGGVTVYCKCVAGYINTGGRCEPPSQGAVSLLAQRKSSDVRVGRMSDCEAMAQLFEELGRGVHWDLERIADLTGSMVAGGVRFRDVTLVAPPSSGIVTFGQSGFDSKYVDRMPGNQVRHFVAYFVVGAKLSGGRLAAAIADLRESHEPGDHYLGIVAASIGEQMRNSPHLVPGIGNSIRGTICR